MGFDRIVNMVLRRLIGQAVNFGVKAGVNAMARRRGGPRNDGTQPVARSADQAERDRIRAVRQARRARRDQQSG
ncbi:hypothetical protein [Tritonibacter horizontis]|uniref:Uncharacterized protein n=1 Tax=Tritonibacter horizontis TaxID=1768241 RepID=A0A132C0K1_9RHOB|nr:hypothetical protein [Tritonibacter horizontis]KUP94104.1 hypothetical protein TRIHO_10330 [Tritonibacter horizontis]